MGFFDALAEGAKKLTDRVTGGYGEITFNVDREQLSPGDSLGVEIDIKATGDLEAKRVLVRIRGKEKCTLHVKYQDEGGMSQTETHETTEYTMDKEFEVCGALKMSQSETKSIRETITIPDDCQPTYFGVNCEHKWEIEADVDVPWGKDLTKTKELYIY